MKKVVIDTKVFISGIFWGGNEGKVLDHCISGILRNQTSPQIIDEIEKVLGYEKFHLSKMEILSLLRIYISMSEINYPVEQVDIVDSDPSDNKFIECCLSSGAVFLITGDRDLLRIGEFQDILITNSKIFLDEQLFHFL